MDLPSVSGASEEPNWIFWKDFSKYNSLPRNKEAVGSFTADLFNDARILGREDNQGERERYSLITLLLYVCIIDPFIISLA